MYRLRLTWHEELTQGCRSSRTPPLEKSHKHATDSDARPGKELLHALCQGSAGNRRISESGPSTYNNLRLNCERRGNHRIDFLLSSLETA